MPMPNRQSAAVCHQAPLVIKAWTDVTCRSLVTSADESGALGCETYVRVSRGAGRGEMRVICVPVSSPRLATVSNLISILVVE